MFCKRFPRAILVILNDKDIQFCFIVRKSLFARKNFISVNELYMTDVNEGACHNLQLIIVNDGRISLCKLSLWMILLLESIILSEQTSSQASSSISEETLRTSLLREMAKYVALTVDYHGVNDRQSGVNAAHSARSHWRRKELRPSFMSANSRSRLTESSEFGLAKRMRRRGVFRRDQRTRHLAKPTLRHSLHISRSRAMLHNTLYSYNRYEMHPERYKFLSLD